MCCHLFEDTAATLHPPGIRTALLWLRNTSALVLAVEAREGSEHSRQSSPSHCVVLPPLRVHDGHRSSTAEKHVPWCWPTEKHKCIVLTMKGQAERLMEPIGHLFKDMMATYHSLGIAGKVAGKIVKHPVGLPTALEEMWCETSPARTQQCVHDGRRCGHILAPSVLQYRHSRVPAPNRSGATVDCSHDIQHGDVRIGGLMNRDFCSRHDYSLFTMSFALACHRLEQGCDSDIVAEDNHEFRKFYFRRAVAFQPSNRRWPGFGRHGATPGE